MLVQALMPGEQLTETEIEARLGWTNTTVRRAHRFARKHGMLRRRKSGRAYRYYVPTPPGSRRPATGAQLGKAAEHAARSSRVDCGAS